jgi:hypothetical protein
MHSKARIKKNIGLQRAVAKKRAAGAETKAVGGQKRTTDHVKAQNSLPEAENKREISHSR